MTLIVISLSYIFQGRTFVDSFKGNQSVTVDVVPDTAIFSSMAQVNKAVIGAKTVFADGG